MKRLILAAFGLLALLPVAANAAMPSWISEVRGGVLTHDSELPDFWNNRIEGGVDLNLELLFNGPAFLSYIGTPRFQLGGQLSVDGDTNMAYTGLQWQRDFDCGFFLAGYFGFAIHDGKVDISQKDEFGNITPESNERFQNTKRFGSRVLFRFGPEIGYNFDAHNSLSVTWAHASNGKILGGDDAPNQGQDNVGIRYGYKF